MKKVLFITAISSLIFSSAVAQEPSRTFNFTITSEDLQVIGKALDERPFKEAAPVIQRLNQQVQSQVKPPVPMPTKPEAKGTE